MIQLHREQYPIHEKFLTASFQLYIAALNLSLTLIGSSTNLIIIIFLLKNKNVKDVPTLLFVVLCVTDFLCCTVLGAFQTLISFRVIKLTSFVNNSFFSVKVISMFYNVIVSRF